MGRHLFCAVIFMAAFMLAQPAGAIDFKARGLWQFGVGVGEHYLATEANGKKIYNKPITQDQFKARQRIRQFLDFIASENLSGTLGFEIGHIRWGQASTGGALGADGNIIKLRQAYIDWIWPDSALRTRMGIQNITLPTAAGSSNILANMEVAGIVSNLEINDNIGITGMWLRPYNDNFTGNASGRDADYLDNIDLFLLGIPLKFENAEITPWAMYGMQGRNSFRRANANGTYNYVWQGNDAGAFIGAINSIPFGSLNQQNSTTKDYGSLFWFGLPIKINLDPFLFEFEFDYGYVGPLGRYEVMKAHQDGMYYSKERASTQREGWLLKALASYKMDWGTPNIYGWYASGDDGSLKNGSKRLPYIYAETKFTSILGDDTCLYGGIGGNDRSLSLDGKWGIGVGVKDVSFIHNVKHMLRATWIQGTNDPSMVKYAQYLAKGSSYADAPGLSWLGITTPQCNDYYLTTRDNLLEIDFHNVVTIYENLKMGLEFSYVFNMLDQNLWKKADKTTFSKSDMWVADLTFVYSF